MPEPEPLAEDTIDTSRRAGQQQERLEAEQQAQPMVAEVGPELAEELTPETEQLYGAGEGDRSEPEGDAGLEPLPAQASPKLEEAEGMQSMRMIPTQSREQLSEDKGNSFFLDPRFVRHLTSVFTPRFVAYISFSHHLVKGVLAGGGSSGMVLSQRNIYVIKGVPARDKQLFTAAASTPWAIKPVLGLINDTLPIDGWEKSIYLLGAAFAGSAAWLTIALFGERIPGAAICVCFITILTQVAWTDLMVEGLYTVRMKKLPAYGSDLVTYVWSGITFCGAIGVLLAGPAIDLLGPYNVAFIAVPLAAAIIVPTLLGWHGEQRLPVARRGLNHAKIQEQKDVVVTAAVLGTACVLTAGSAIMGMEDNSQFALVLLCLAAVLTTVYQRLDRGLATVCIYMAAAQAVAIDTSGPADFFFLSGVDDPASRCKPLHGFGCPEFSASFYFTIVGMLDSVCALIGTALFNTTMRDWTYVKALNVSMVMLVCGHTLDILMYQRWNRVVGIPDWLFMLGKASITGTVYMMNFLPTTLLISKICPDGVETTTYAMLAGVSNFGQSVASYAGTFVLAPFGLDQINGQCDDGCCVGEGCTCDDGCDDFSNMWRLSVLGTLMPLLTIGLNYALVPPIRMSSGIAVDPDTGALSEVPAADAAVGRTAKKRSKSSSAKGAQKYAQLARESVSDSDPEP